MRIVPRQVDLIASTSINLEVLARLEPEWFSGIETGAPETQTLIEFAGRACYQSWSRPNPATATNARYIAHVLKQRHFSVFEHATATFYFQGVSRSFTHELIRHRHLSYSQLSQRFVDSSDTELVIHPAVAELVEEERTDPEVVSVDHFVDEKLDYLITAVSDFYGEVTEALKVKGLKVKEIREAARGALPNMTATKIVVTGNMRAWRHFILMRATPHADREIREIAVDVYKMLLGSHPDIFADMTLGMYEGKYEVVASPYGEEDH